MEATEDSDVGFEETKSKCYFTHYSQTAFAMKANKKDRRIPTSFTEACKIPEWANAIDREYEALVNRETWTYVPKSTRHETSPISVGF